MVHGIYVLCMLSDIDDTLVEYFDRRIIFRLFTGHWSSVFISPLFYLIWFHRIPIFGGLFRSICIMYILVYFLVILCKFVRWFFFSIFSVLFRIQFTWQKTWLQNLHVNLEYMVLFLYQFHVQCTLYTFTTCGMPFQMGEWYILLL